METKERREKTVPRESRYFESWLFYDLNPGLFLCVRVVGLCGSGVVFVSLSGLSSRRGAEPQ